MQPYRMITITDIADQGEEKPYATARKRIQLVRRNLKRKNIPPGEWTWTVERNPKGTGFHCHALQIGRYVSQNVLQDACTKANAGWPDIRAIRRKGLWTSRYGMKGFGADGYGLKCFRSSDKAHDALDINGGAVEHHSVEFFNINGKQQKVRRVEKMAIAKLNEGKKIAYIGCAPDEVERLLGDHRLRNRSIEIIERRNAELLAYDRG